MKVFNCTSTYQRLQRSSSSLHNTCTTTTNLHGPFDQYPFIRKQGYNPALLYLSILQSLMVGRQRFDVLTNCFRVIRNVYSHKTLEEAHKILEKDIEIFGSALNMALYLDGPKWSRRRTRLGHEEKLAKSAGEVENCLDTFQSRLGDDMRIRRRHHTDIKS
ncbi:MAG: hypothetical protein J3R72DRAFT_417874 [Linnemannia gamsii]|nr:MAG: hypothetical protein J3R72DRAFT_417874 [Linnemannia gamsii]